MIIYIMFNNFNKNKFKIMKKVFLAAFAIALVAVSCEKKEEVTTTETTIVTPVDSTASPVEQTTTTTVVETPVKYESNDGKTTFSVVFDAEAGTAVVTNETTGKVYNMKSVVTASGSRYEDADKNFFQEHQGGFQFGQGETTQVEGKAK